MPRIGAGRIFFSSVLALLCLASSGTAAATVSGQLEWVDCDGIVGWAQDSSDPATPLAIELSFDAPLAEKPDGAFTANTPRDDLCASLGSCEHGFDIAPPYSLFDAAPHGVYVYANDLAQSEQTLLPGGPATMVCASPAVSGYKRRIASAATSVNWRFDLFWSGVPLDDASIDSLPDDPELPEAPELARADDGSADVWLIDGTLRRSIPSEAVLSHWRFSEQAIATLPAAEIDSLTEGPPLGSRPLLVHSSFDELFLIDAELPIEVVDGAEPDPPPQQADSNPSSQPGGEPGSAACAARVAPGAPVGQGQSAALWLLAAFVLIRSRSARR